MTNRLPNDARSAIFCAVFAFFLLNTFGLRAQPFTFSYPGPTIIGVGPGCEANLADKLGTPNVTSTIGAAITMSMFDSVATGFGLYSPLPIGMHSIRWLVKDDQGNSAHYTFKVTLVDNTPPEFDLNGVPPVLMVGSITQVPPPFLPVSDNCTPLIDIDTTYTQTTPPGLCQSGTFTRTWTAMDNSGNTTVFTQTVQVTADNQPPSLGALPQGLNAVCSDLPTQYSNWLAAQLALVTSGASDPSGIKSITHNGPATYPAGCPASVTVVFRVTDSCDIFNTASATFVASDTQAPVVISPAIDTFAYCTADSSYLQKLGDYIHNRGWLQMEDCTLSPRSTWSMRVNGTTLDSAGVVAALLASFSQPCDFKLIGVKSYPKVRGWIPIDFFVRDACNQLTVDRGEFGIIDTLGPQISGQVTTEQCGGGNDQTALEAWINARGNATAKDGCSSVFWNNTFNYTTSNGQIGSGTINAGPYPTVPANACSWFVDVTFRASDDCGNNGSGTVRFRVVDTQPPVLTIAQPSTTIYCPEEVPTILPQPMVTDNCDTAPQVDSIRQVIPDGNPLCTGNYTVRITWQAIDKCGNTSTAIQTFFVRDTAGPVFDVLPLTTVIRCDTFVLPPVPIAGVNIFASDECSPVQSIKTQTLSGQNPNPATCGHYNYTITRIFLATDGCGNTSTATQAINVVDNLGPVLSGIADTVMQCDVTPLPPPPTGLDACSGPVSTVVVQNSTDAPGSCPDQFTRTIVYRAYDVCGNFGEFTQTIHVVDTVKPILIGIPADVTVSCENIPPPPANASFVAQDNCDADLDIVLVESEVRDPSLTSCDHWSNYLILRTWTVTDNCGNSRAYTQTIAVRDNTPPVLTMPADITRPADVGQCSANTPIPAPISLFDECTALQTTVTLSNTLPITNASGTFSATEPVNPINYSWSSPNLPPGQPVIGTPSVRFFIYNADINNATEYFNIAVEGDPIGSTGITGGNENCRSDSSTVISVSPNKMNQWLADGQLNMVLTPNGTNSAAVNLINCSGPPRVKAVWTYQIATQQTPVELTYQLDNGPATPYTPTSSANLNVGPHTILYTARDCAGNSTSALLTFTVQDLEPPSLVPPANLTVFTGSNNCVASVTLPFPQISENCSLAGSLMRASAIVPIQFESDPEIGDLVPQDAVITINGLIPNAVGNGRLRILHIGDNVLPGEFFHILDETTPTGADLGQTTPGSSVGRCQTFHETVFNNITAAQINAWAANGTATFTVSANRDVANYTNFINNCAPIDPVTKTDGISLIYAILEYNYAKVNYEVRNGATLVKQDTLKGDQTIVDNLAPGSYTVKYSLTDKAGATGTAQFSLMVRDTVRPKALCKPLVTLIVSPSGLSGDNTTLTVGQVNNNSTDNCAAPLTYTLSRTTFSCADAAFSNVSVTLTVQDAAGNTSSCVTQVKAQTPVLTPSFNAGVCEQGTLFLFSNVALVQGVEAYSYTWTTPVGPNFTKDPVFPSATSQYEGPYSLVITSQTGTPGCSATGTVFVDLNNLSVVPVITADSSSYCLGENIRLKTAPYGGTAVTYQWYIRLSGRDSLLKTTPSEIYVLNNWPAGSYRFFVKIADAGCASLNSNELMVDVFPLPVATVFPENIRICDGQSFALGTSSSGAGMTYRWTGPGLTSTMPSPVVNNAKKGINDGNYILVVAQNGCFSKPDTARVTIDETPAAPMMTGNSPVCEGGTLIVNCLPNTAAEYRWIRPSLDTAGVTPDNVFIKANVGLDDAGNWKVVAILQGCVSKVSDPYPVQVLPYPRISPDVKTPLCQGTELVLKATADLMDLDWQWQGPDMFNAFSSIAIRNPAVAGLYSVIAKTRIGNCADTVDVNVTVLQPPVIDSLFTDAPVCASGMADAKIWAKVSNSPKPLKYYWTRQSTGSTTVTNDSIFTIPSISLGDNGNYSLVVENSAGCRSASKAITISVRNVPPPPTPVPDQSEVCLGQNVVLTVTNASMYGGTDVEYLWTTPRTQGNSASNSFAIFNASKVDSGLYCVKVRVGQCTTQQVCTNVLVKSKPLKPVANANNTTLCSGDVLNLFVSPTPVGATYNWQGPIFTSSLPNPSIPDVETIRSGAYQVTTTVNGCSSESDLLFVTVKQRPQTPIARPPSPAALCLDQPDTLKLAFSRNSSTPGATYQWIHNASGANVGPASSDSTLNLPLAGLNFITPGKNTFNVFGALNGCTSAFSTPVEIQFDKIPNSSAFAGRDTLVCDGKPLLLNATAPTIGTGQWTLTAGPNVVIINPSDAHSPVSGIQAGNIYQFKWTLSNGACRNYSSSNVNVRVNQFEPANAGKDLDTCIAGTMRISAVKGQNLSGKWTQMSSQAGLGITIETPDSFTTLVHGLQSGQRYVFTWTLKDIGCGPSSDEKLVRVFSTNVSAGADAQSCDPAGNYTLNASSVRLDIGETGMWIPVTPGISVLKADDPRTTVTGLKTGDNKLIWRTNGGICGAASDDEVIIKYGKPILQDEVFEVAYGTPLSGLDVLANDNLPLEFKFDTIPPFPMGGLVTFANANMRSLTYRPDNGFFGRDSLKYEVCNRECPAVCDVGAAYFDVAPPDSCIIPTIITPNGDGVNDTWILSPACFLELQGDGFTTIEVQVSVFNQWGDEVFHSDNYAKDTPWNGTWKGADLPAGTYFFVVRQPYKTKAPVNSKRFILIQR